MKVLQIVASINAEASGPSQSVPGLCQALAQRHVDVTLHVLGPADQRVGATFELQAHRSLPILRRLGFSPLMRRALGRDAGSANILHNHGLWMMPNVYPAWAVRGTRCQIVVSPRGTLSGWALARSAWKKRIFWRTLQSETITKAVCLHATAEAEYDEIRRFGLTAPVAVIPNGIDIPPVARSAPRSDKRKLLFLGRVHPVKGVDHLLRAWRNVQEQFGDWELHIVGPDEGGHGRLMQDLSRQLGAERVLFAGPLYGDEKSQMYRAADLLVLPSRSENFGNVVAEALAHGVPAIVSKAAPWEALTQLGCGWWHDIGEGPLTEALRTALALSPTKLRGMGSCGRAFAERDLSWSRIGEMMHLTYQWVLGGGTAPDWVRVH
jgi:glycosyltransferase involved in cell wall biosynthesis